jgi:hypothetical protein
VFAAYRKPLEQSDLEAWPICEKDKAVVGRAELESLWEGEKRRPKYDRNFLVVSAGRCRGFGCQLDN